MAIKAYYIPFGPKNLSTIFTGVDFGSIDSYYLEIYDDSTVPVLIGQTTINKMDNCKIDPDKVRIHFVGYCGAIEALNLKLFDRQHESKSAGIQKPTTSPLVVTAHSLSRINVKSNDFFSARIKVEVADESEMTFYDELLDTPLAWIEVPGKSTYYPIVIADKKSQKLKEDDRFYYEIVIDYKFSNERFIIRN